MCSMLASGPLLTKLGQRVMAIVTLPLLAAVWLTFSFTTNVWILLAFRFFSGLLHGFPFISSVTYILEVTHKSVRGRFSAVLFVIQGLAGVLIAIMGLLHLHWRYMGLFASIPVALAFLGMLTLPNSPRWLVTQGRLSDARRSILFFRGQQYDHEEELKEIIEETDDQNGGRKGTLQQLREILQPSTLRMFCFIAGLNVLCGCNGLFLMQTYLVPIFQATQSSIDPYLSAVIFTSVRLLASCVNLCLMDKFGRKFLYIMCCIFCTISMAAFGGYFYLLKIGIDDNINWLPLFSSLVFIFFAFMSQTVINIYQGEPLPTSCRAVGVTISMALRVLATFTVTEMYADMTVTLGEYGTFWFFSGCFFLAGLVVLILPETRGLSLEEITQEQRRRSSVRDFNTPGVTSENVSE